MIEKEHSGVVFGTVQKVRNIVELPKSELDCRNSKKQGWQSTVLEAITGVQPNDPYLKCVNGKEMIV